MFLFFYFASYIIIPIIQFFYRGTIYENINSLSSNLYLFCSLRFSNFRHTPYNQSIPHHISISFQSLRIRKKRSVEVRTKKTELLSKQSRLLTSTKNPLTHPLLYAILLSSQTSINFVLIARISVYFKLSKSIFTCSSSVVLRVM